MSDYDIVVVGAGMVGSAAAAVFGQRGLRVAVVEARMPQGDLNDGKIDLRVSAISRASQELLQQVGAWQNIDSKTISPYGEMRVWDADVPPESADVVHFDAADIGEPELGFIIENRRIQDALHRCLNALPSVVLFTPCSVEDLTRCDDAIAVRLDDGRKLKARLVIGADGARSRTRELAAIATRGWSYEQKAVVTHVTTSNSHRETAYQRFLTDGPIALLPLYDGRSSVVWSTTPGHADELLALEQESFCRRVEEATDAVLGRVTHSDRRAAFPLQLLHAVDYVRPNLVLIGDAAHAVHPLAGQGVNLGFADVRKLGDVCREVDTLELGDLSVLRRYERERKSENLLMMGSVDALNRLFRADTPLVGRARQVGMSLFNRIPPLKHAIIRRAMKGGQ
ncbi:MAG: UbiH/UbiF/VisC/COQ6 family ubiquinone biosynthesis hydroxylase [Gammaproteobacteria bacterium]|nr:UbiH/UbiF/VisC/COQ6 family ubiquinone biosynthesis hydroxylase [Gammaproteobacteria bacterium]